MTPEEIATLDDPRMADYRAVTNPEALVRAGLFVAEGRFVVSRLLRLGAFRVRSLLLTTAASEALAGELHARRSDEAAAVYVVTQPIMNAVVGFNIHRGCLAIAERPPVRTLDAVALDTVSRAIVLEGVSNPDNIGGIFRSAAAFAADLVVLGPGCGDPLYRKAIRTSMAATLQVPFAAAGAWPDALSTLRTHAIKLLALSTEERARPLTEVARRAGRVALLVGNEGSGLTSAALAAADQQVRIRMSPQVDSLNVTVAASIAMHHCF